MKKSNQLPARRTLPPKTWQAEVEQVLISEAQLAKRIKTLASEIQRDYSGKEMVIVSLLNGTVMFLADLIRHLSMPLRLDFIGVSSYGEGTESRELVYTKELRLDVRGRDVLLVDDILDTGKTLKSVVTKLQHLKPREIKTCVLLDKPERRVEKVEADYVGFTIPNYFVVGYGLDFAEKYRNLPFVGVLHPRMYRKRDFEFVSVAANYPDEKKKVLAFLQKQQASNKNYIFAENDKYKMMTAFDPSWEGGLPFTVLINPTGQIVYSKQGEVDVLQLRRKILEGLGRIK